MSSGTQGQGDRLGSGREFVVRDLFLDVLSAVCDRFLVTGGAISSEFVDENYYRIDVASYLRVILGCYVSCY